MEEDYVCRAQEDILFSNLCIDYLNFEGFRDGATGISALISSGYYAFMDYAVTYWIRHLESGLSETQDHSELIHALSESLEAFLTWHFTPPAKQFYVSQSNVKRLQVFEDYLFYDDLQKSIISARKELTFVGELKPGELALNLSRIVGDIRSHLETVYETATGCEAKAKMESVYGSNIYKCPRLSCSCFCDGFPSRSHRDQHVEKHLLPFRCDVVGCPSATIGMSTEKELKKHKKDTHENHEHNDLDFPEEAELRPQSIPETQTDQRAPAQALVAPQPKPSYETRSGQ
jgi:hypothetical protein